MADIGDEVLPGAFELFEAGQVVKHEDRAAIGVSVSCERCAIDLNPALDWKSQPDLAIEQRGFGFQEVCHVNEFMKPYRFEDGPRPNIGTDAKELYESAIGQSDPAVAVQQQ